MSLIHTTQGKTWVYRDLLVESRCCENCHGNLCAILPGKKGLGFKLSRKRKIGENTKDFWSAPEKVVEEPLNCGFAFRMCLNRAHWNMLQFIIHPYEIWGSKNWWRSCRFSHGAFVLSQEKGHPFHPQWAVPTSHILSSKKSHSGETLHLE